MATELWQSPCRYAKDDGLDSDEEELGIQQLLLTPIGANYGTHEEKHDITSSPGASAADRLLHEFGFELLLLIFLVAHLLSGFSKTLVSKVTPFVYLSFKVPAPTTQIYNSLMKLPYVARPIFGLLSDVLPIGGYRLGPYMLFVTFFGVAGLVYLASPAFGVPVSSSVMPTVVALVLFWFQVSICDLLTGVRYNESIAMKPNLGAGLMSYVSFGFHVCEFVAVALSGYLLVDPWGYSSAFVVTIGPAAAVAFPILMGYLQEQKATPEEISQVRRRYWDQLEVCLLAPLLFTGALAIMYVGVFLQNPVISVQVALVVAALVLVAFAITLTPHLAKFNIFLLLVMACRPDYGGATFYFFTDTPEMYPEGPHFSVYFFTSTLGMVTAVFGIIGALTYYHYFRTWSLRHIVLVTNVLFAALSAMDILMLTRVSKRLGIPDHVLFMSLSACENLLEQWVVLPAVLMLAELCPRGMLGTMYAIMLGAVHLGQSVAGNIGAYLLDFFEVRPRGEVGEGAQFDNLWIVATISGVMAFLCTILLSFLIPDVRREGGQPSVVPRDASEGSLWRLLRSPVR